MFKMRLEILFALLATFALVATDHAASKAVAAGLCQSESATPGFNVGSQTRGSVVTLCGKFVQQATSIIDKPVVAKPQSRTLPPRKPANTEVPRAKPIDPKMAAKLLHRKVAMAGQSSFTPTRLVILAEKPVAKPMQSIRVHIAHSLQYRTAFLVGRFFSLRFTPLKVDLHFDRGSHASSVFANGFSASVTFKTKGMHAIRGVVTYVAEYRLNGSKNWHAVEGRPQLAAVSARVFVRGIGARTPDLSGSSRKPLLVANDCLQNTVLVGCLN